MTKKIHAGIVGCGGASQLHEAGYMGCSRVEVVACCDIVRERAEETARSIGAKSVYTDYEEMLRDPEIDLVDITLPNLLHAPFAVRAAEAGKHVLVEKPFGMTVEECDEMMGAARKAGVRITNAESYVYYPPYVKLKEVIESGELGEPVSIRVKYSSWPEQGLKKSHGNPLLYPGALTYESVGYRVNTGEFPAEKLMYEGRLFSGGIHMLSVAYNLLGDFEKVFAMMEGKQEECRFRDRSDWLMWKYRGRPIYGVMEGYSKGPVYRDFVFEVTGTQAIGLATGALERLLRGAGVTPLLVYSEEGVKYYCAHPRLAHQGQAVGTLDLFKHMIQDFVDGVLDDREFRWKAEDGKRVVEIILAMYKSAREGREIAV